MMSSVANLQLKVLHTFGHSKLHIENSAMYPPSKVSFQPKHYVVKISRNLDDVKHCEFTVEGSTHFQS